MEGEARVALEPLAHLWMLVSGIIVEDDVDALADRHLALDRIEEADELLMPVALHVAADHGAVERVDLRLLVERQHDRVGGRIDIEPDHVAQLLDEQGIVRQLELPHPVRLKAVGAPDALDRADADPDLARHHRGGPMGRFEGRGGQGQRDDALGYFGPERRNARGSRLVAKEAVHAFFGEALLPAPDAGLRLARQPHDRDRAHALRAEQDDTGAPDMLLSGVAVADQRLQAPAVGWRDLDRDTYAHATDSHAKASTGIPYKTRPSDFIH